MTAVRDGMAWERLALRIQKGDLRKWMRDLDELRHDVDAKLLVPLPWSPLKDVDFDDMPTDGREHELTLYMEDTMRQQTGARVRGDHAILSISADILL